MVGFGRVVVFAFVKPGILVAVAVGIEARRAQGMFESARERKGLVLPLGPLGDCLGFWLRPLRGERSLQQGWRELGG